MNPDAVIAATKQQDVVARPSFSFDRPAEIVEVAERIYRQYFSVGLWAAAGFAAFAAAASLLQPASSQLRGFVVCGTLCAVITTAAINPAALYRRLRRHPWVLLIPAAMLAGSAVIIGPQNAQMFLPMVAVIGVLGIAAPMSVVATAGLLAAAGLGAPQLVSGEGNLAAAIAVIVPTLMFWLIVERIASFALTLQRSLEAATVDARPLDEEPVNRIFDADGGHDAGGPGDVRRTRELAEPKIIEVCGIRLSSRQLQVVLLACEGLKDAEIGACLCIGPQQVRRHLREARERTGSESSAQLAAWARRTGLVPRREGRGASMAARPQGET